MIYLDYSATTPISYEVLDTISKVSKDFIGNPNSIHALGKNSKKLMDSATKQIADILGVNSSEIIYTSGATECNNMALIGIALANHKKGKHIIVSKLEHPSIYGICNYLESIGFEISYVKNDRDGLIDFDDLKKLVRDDTILVSICAVNSEIGIRQPLKMIRQIIKKENIGTVLHSDMSQAVGKISINMRDVDLATMTGEKIFGPKGIGILYKSSMVKLTPLFYGSDANNLRPGTPVLPLIAAMSKAMRLANDNIEKKERFINLLNNKIITELKTYENIIINNTKYSIPHVINISVLDVMPEVLVNALSEKEIYVSTNTACHSKEMSTSVMALYNDSKRAKHTIRISLSHATTTEEINNFLKAFKEVYNRLSNLK